MPIDKPSKEDVAFWDKALHDHGLGMNRGRRAWLSYGHEDREKDEATEDSYSEESLP
jgi:hypothetical protein